MNPVISSLINIFYNPIILPTIVAYMASIFLKIIYESISKKHLSIGAGFQDGGMPSSHTAAVVGLSTSILLQEGLSTAFWVSLVFATVVMKDAIGVRWETGQQAKAINEIMKRLRMRKVLEEDLKELLGHTEAQVLGGFIVGVIFAYIGRIAFF